MRSALLPVVRKITSSRQSPRTSPDSAGVDLVPLLDVVPSAVSSRVSPPVPYLSTWLLSSSSRTVSASHQARKFAEPGLRPMLAPEALRRLPMFGPAPQYSAPALPDQMSAATPRPGPSTPLLLGVAKIRAPLLAERRSAPICELDS